MWAPIRIKQTDKGIYPYKTSAEVLSYGPLSAGKVYGGIYRCRLMFCFIS